MGNSISGAEAPVKAGEVSTAESSSSSPKSGKRSTTNVSLSDRLAIFQSAAKALEPYGVETGVIQYYHGGERAVAIILTGNVELVDGRLVAINGKAAEPQP